jgi:predicted Zn-dependent peptidase
LKENKDHVQVYYDAYHADVAAQLSDLVHEAAYGESSALGHSVFGSDLSKVCVQQVLAYRNANFLRENLVIAASGISADTLKKIVASSSGAFVSKSNKPTTFAASPYVGGEVKVRADLNGSTNLAVAFPVPAGEAGMFFF